MNEFKRILIEKETVASVKNLAKYENLVNFPVKLS